MRDVLIWCVGLVTIVFVLPNILLWVTVHWFRGKATKALTVVAPAPDPDPDQHAVFTPKAEPTDDEWHKKPARGSRERTRGKRVSFERDREHERDDWELDLDDGQVQYQPYLAVLRFQAASADQVSDLDKLSLPELQARRDQLGAMLHFLATTGHDLCTKAERKSLKDKLDMQRKMVFSWLEIRRQSDYTDYQNWRNRVAEIQRQRIRLVN